jgi:hypothetical protein
MAGIAKHPPRRDRFVRIGGSRKRELRERKFITATKIRPSRDIAVMAEFQRNAGIPVALAAR